MNEIIWYPPCLKKIDIEDLLKKVSVKAASYETDDCYGGNILKGNIGDPSIPLPPGDWALYCIEFGPLGGCERFIVCSENGIIILSSDDDYSKI